MAYSTGKGRLEGFIRQWKLVRVLQGARMGMTLEQLVAAAGEPVSERTIRRDIDILTLAGFPVDVESGNRFDGSQMKVFWREETVN